MTEAIQQRDLAQDLIDLAQVDDFWTVARDSKLVGLMGDGPVLDVGCGSGILTERLLGEGYNVYSVDVDKRCCDYTKKINPHVFHGDFGSMELTGLPPMGTVVMADVLEHVEKDALFVARAHEILKEKGKLLVCVPAYDFFWSMNDDARGHLRRYSRKSLKNLFVNNGFNVKKMMYWNALAIPPILVGKLFRFRVPHEGFSKSPLNAVLRNYLVHFENKLPLPIGSALICEGEKR